MDINLVYDLMNHLENSTISRLELEVEGMKIKLDKSCGQLYTQSLPINGKGNDIGGANDNMTSFDGKTNKNFEDDSFVEVRTKVAGTFYQAATPDREPFVKVGQQVHKGDVIGIIEAMKMMNDITSPVDGVISKILVQNEQVVGYDDLLILIDGGMN